MKYVITALVIGVLVFAGVFVFWQMNRTGELEAVTPNTIQNMQDKTGQMTPANQKPAAQNTGSQQGMMPNAQPDSGIVAKLLAMNPPTGATQDQIKEFSSQVSKASVKSDTVDVSACSPNPAVVQVKMGSSFTIKNPDSTSHKLFHGSIFKNLEIAARGQKVINTNDFPGPGVYAYSCDTKQAGIIFVLQN